MYKSPRFRNAKILVRALLRRLSWSCFDDCFCFADSSESVPALCFEVLSPSDVTDFCNDSLCVPATTSVDDEVGVPVGGILPFRPDEKGEKEERREVAEVSTPDFGSDGNEVLDLLASSAYGSFDRDGGMAGATP